MEYRRLIAFGKNSYVISLPKTWIKHNQLVKGDFIYIEEDNNNLTLSKKEVDASNKEKEKVILVDGKDKAGINREACSAYINNYSKIIFKGKEIKSKVKDIQEIIQGLIALETMEQTSESILARDFLNMDTVSIKELIHKMDIVTRTMIKETCQIFNEDNYVNINQRDSDVNRLYFLLYRSVLYNLENPIRAVKNFNLTSKDMLKMHMVGFYIEVIADEARRVARFARLLEISSHKKKEIESLLGRICAYYEETIKSYYNNDLPLAINLSNKKDVFYKEFESFNEDLMKVKEMNKFINRLQRITSLIHNLGRIIYTIE